jgi:hypothetical protein
MEVHHLPLNVALPMLNAQHDEFSAEWTAAVLAKLSEGAIGPPSNWELINKE